MAYWSWLRFENTYATAITPDELRPARFADAFSVKGRDDSAAFRGDRTLIEPFDSQRAAAAQAQLRAAATVASMRWRALGPRAEAAPQLESGGTFSEGFGARWVN